MDIVLLMVGLAGFLIIVVNGIRKISDCSLGKSESLIKSRVFFILIGIIVVESLIAIFGSLFVSGISGAIFTLVITASIILVASFYLSSKKELTGTAIKNSSFLLKALTVVVLVEIFIFNFPSLTLLGSDLSPVKIDFSDVSLYNFTLENNNLSPSEKESHIIIEDINRPVQTIKFDMTMNSDTPCVNAYVEFSDSTYAALRSVDAKATILKGVKSSGYMQCQFSGNVKELKVLFNTGDNQSFTLNGITLNERIPYNFSFVRVFSLLFIVVSMYLFLNSPRLKKHIGEDEINFKKASLIITVFIMAFSAVLIVLKTPPTMELFKSVTGDQISKELVDAFRDGHLYLNDKPSEGITSLVNPYDFSQRTDSGIAYLWDHVLYNGNYYSYYGIAPVLLLFLPYNVLTNYYFPIQYAVLLFSIIGIFFLTKTYLALVERKFPGLRFNIALMGLLMLQLVSGIFYSVARPKFYELSIAAGFAFVTMGSFFLLSSNIIGGGKISFWRILFSSVFFSLGVLSRPTTAVMSMAALVFAAFGFFTLKKQKTGFRGYITYLICALLPFAVFGCIQMAYNYMRFGSVLDFGIQYSLTINDFVNAQFHIKFVFASLYAFLFAFPYFVPKFPYVTSSFQRFSINGYFYVDDWDISGLAIGIFMKALPMWSYFAIKPAYKLMQKDTRKRDIILIFAFCVIAPLIIMISIWESGFAIRYTADIYWPMMIGALCIFYILFQNQTGQTKRILEVFFTAALFLTGLICSAQLFNFYSDAIYCPEITDYMNYIRYTFEIIK